MRIFLWAALFCTVLSSCGGGGGGGDGGGGVTVTVPGTQLGTRAVPGYTLAVSSPATVQPGATLSVQAMVTPDADIAAPVQVEAAIGASEPTVWLAGSVSGQAWTWTVTLPADLTGQRVWVRLTDPDGNSAGSGCDDFALMP